MNKETLEEAADRYAEIYRCPATNNKEYCKHDIISAINLGAKWQAERMYSEEEVRLMLAESFKASQEGYNITSDEIIEQFKKK